MSRLVRVDDAYHPSEDVAQGLTEMVDTKSSAVRKLSISQMDESEKVHVQWLLEKANNLKFDIEMKYR